MQSLKKLDLKWNLRKKKESISGKRKLIQFEAGAGEIENTSTKRSRIDPQKTIQRIIDLVQSGEVLSSKERKLFFNQQIDIRAFLSNSQEDLEFIAKMDKTIDLIYMQYWNTQEIQISDGHLVLSEKLKKRISEDDLTMILRVADKYTLNTIISLDVPVSVPGPLFDLLRVHCSNLSDEFLEKITTDKVSCKDLWQLIRNYPEEDRENLLEIVSLIQYFRDVAPLNNESFQALELFVKCIQKFSSRDQKNLIESFRINFEQNTNKFDPSDFSKIFQNMAQGCITLENKNIPPFHKLQRVPDTATGSLSSCAEELKEKRQLAAAWQKTSLEAREKVLTFPKKITCRYFDYIASAN